MHAHAPHTHKYTHIHTQKCVLKRPFASVAHNMQKDCMDAWKRCMDARGCCMDAWMHENVAWMRRVHMSSAWTLTKNRTPVRSPHASLVHTRTKHHMGRMDACVHGHVIENMRQQCFRTFPAAALPPPPSSHRLHPAQPMQG